MLRQARTFNLIFYLLLAVLAVALALAAVRGLLACIALLPMPLQLAGSLSPVGAGHGVLLHSASRLRLRTKSRVVGKILLIALGGAVGPAKAIYLPVVLLCFIIPADNLCGADGICPGLVWRARALRAVAHPGGRARAGGLPVALRQPR